MTTGVPRTRQKSCVACVAAKRKCDQSSPCARCVSKSMACEYKPGRRRQTRGVREVPLPSEIILSDTPMDLRSPLTHHLETDTNTDRTLSLALLDTTGVADPSPGTIIDDSFFMAFDNRGLADTYLEIGVMDRERIAYCVRCLKSYPLSLAHTGRTTFIHPQNYRPTMPKSLQDAISASSLYINKNELNEAMVWEIITTKVTQLTEPKPYWTVAEHLACVQAFVIFQIISLFDGDIKQRSDAEQQEELLTSWTDSLAARTGVTSSSLNSIDRGWETWTFEEAIRRTIIVSRTAQSMFAIQRQGFCTMVGAVTEIPFTAQRRLWAAPSASYFVKACKETRCLWVEKMDLDEIMEKGLVEDLDEIAWLMLVTYTGVDGANEWIMSKGGSTLIE
ncbi:hypothetical protein ONS95_005898 [Cadophora gregata]|uniref:uncharacterized protein n=1 Tax=Cadophora gregata TaxID=51156 RepID=UPI0026DD8451|nr:uncharacterized protein ONS95_005898 [Cadophora gregata]KAK0102276.1 hypothetical protein ONS95_005898 [Cadophora gregata]KAK0103903.1 hypothetical protein ONS96_005011 [Cadophora gregata f. sp. sojae]